MSFSLSGISAATSNGPARHVKVLILGAGPAGLSAALYAARAELAPVVLTGTQLGGQAALTHTIENYPGFPTGVGGADLGELFQKQAERFGAQIEYGSASAVDLSQRPFKVSTDSGVFLADSLIIATGATPTHLEIPGEIEYTGQGVSYCATCDGWFFKEKHVIVVGGGDSALEESLFLTRYVKSVTLIHRRDAFRAGKILQNRVFAEPKIKVIWNSVLTSLIGNHKVETAVLKNIQTGESSQLHIDGVFIFVGHRPNTDIFKPWLEMDANGYIKTDNLMQTNISGVYVAGEAGDPIFRQVITSAGMGAAAAMQAIKFLEAETIEA